MENTNPTRVPDPYRIYAGDELVAETKHTKPAASVADMYGAGTSIWFRGVEVIHINVNGQPGALKALQDYGIPSEGV